MFLRKSKNSHNLKMFCTSKIAVANFLLKPVWIVTNMKSTRNLLNNQNDKLQFIFEWCSKYSSLTEIDRVGGQIKASYMPFFYAKFLQRKKHFLNYTACSIYLFTIKLNDKVFVDGRCLWQNGKPAILPIFATKYSRSILNQRMQCFNSEEFQDNSRMNHA